MNSLATGAVPDAASLAGATGIAGVVPAAQELRQRLGDSKFYYSGQAPQFSAADGGDVTSVQHNMCSGVSDTFAQVDGGIRISMQYLFATGLKQPPLALKVEGRVEGDVVINAARSGSVGGTLNVELSAKTRGITIHDADTHGGGFADKTILVTHAQQLPLRVELGDRMNFLSDYQIEIGGLGSDGITVTSSGMVHFNVSDSEVDGTRVLRIDRAG